MNILLKEYEGNMHAVEREELILRLVEERGFVTFRDLNRRLSASPATLRRDLARLDSEGKIIRVRGGVRTCETASGLQLKGRPFDENIQRNQEAKAAIGKLSASLCRPGEAVIIDGGSTTLQMCPHLADLGLHVLTNSLHIVNALLPQPRTHISIPGGALFREQNIILSPHADDGVSHYHASRMFLGAAAIRPQGVMQNDVILVQAERKLFARADEIVVLVDSSKFEASAGHVLCSLEDIDMLVTDDGIKDADAQMLEQAGVKLALSS